MRNTLDLINITEGKSYYNVPKINTLKEMLKMCVRIITLKYCF